MRCVSKCFVGSRSLRVYSLLFLGMVLGFSLSTIIHTFGTPLMLQETAMAASAQEPQPRQDHTDTPPGQGRVAFSNINNNEVMEEEQNDFREYGYEKEVETKHRAGDVGVAKGQKSAPSSEHIKVKMKEREKESVGDEVPNTILKEIPGREIVMVAVVTSVTQLMTQTLAIQGTWASSAHVIFFVGEEETMPHLPYGMEVIQLEGVDDQDENWNLKEISAIKYLIDHHLEHAKWFMMIGDQTYVVMEHLERTLNALDASSPMYVGLPGEPATDGSSLPCQQHPGVLYSRALLEGLRPYLPMCWPGGGQGEGNSVRLCVAIMGLECSQVAEMNQLFVSGARDLVESPSLFTGSSLAKALAIHPVQFPKFMYRVHCYFEELQYNTSMQRATAALTNIHATQPFIPAHLRTSFRPRPPTASTAATTLPTTPPSQASSEGGVVVRPRYVPKNKFELNSWEYFNQTRLMTIMNESPARGIIGGIREEARYALTKAIYQANQGLPQAQRYVFDKLENGYHRVDPMRGSEFILDFVFRRQSDKNSRVRRRLAILRPFHEVVVPIDAPEMLPTVNFLVTLSGLSTRLEHFLKQYERTVLQLGEDATLTIVLFQSPDAFKVKMMIQQYLTRYQSAQMTVLDVQGEFARGIGLHYGLNKFDKNQLVFIVDVDLDISTDFLQRCRLNALSGKQVYFPVFFKLYNQEFVNQYHRGNHSLLIARHRGHWAHYSYGMVCLYAGDYVRTGGFDVSMRGWGEEDVDLLSKVLKSGLEVFRAPDPGLIHNWHSKMCNGDKVTNSKAYEHCLQSKGENLADRIELAQYVFASEMKKGNNKL